MKANLGKAVLTLLKNAVYGIVASSLLFAAQTASAGGTQFWSEKYQRYQSVSSLPFDAFPSGEQGIRGPVGPKGEPAMPKAGAPRTPFPAPYDRGGGYFN